MIHYFVLLFIYYFNKYFYVYLAHENISDLSKNYLKTFFVNIKVIIKNNFHKYTINKSNDIENIDLGLLRLFREPRRR